MNLSQIVAMTRILIRTWISRSYNWFCQECNEKEANQPSCAVRGSDIDGI